MQHTGRDKSFVYDLTIEPGTVRVRVASVPRSTEVQPGFVRFDTFHYFYIPFHLPTTIYYLLHTNYLLLIPHYSIYVYCSVTLLFYAYTYTYAYAHAHAHAHALVFSITTLLYSTLFHSRLLDSVPWTDYSALSSSLISPLFSFQLVHTISSTQTCIYILCCLLTCLLTYLLSIHSDLSILIGWWRLC